MNEHSKTKHIKINEDGSEKSFRNSEEILEMPRHI